MHDIWCLFSISKMFFLPKNTTVIGLLETFLFVNHIKTFSVFLDMEMNTGRPIRLHLQDALTYCLQFVIYDLCYCWDNILKSTLWKFQGGGSCPHTPLQAAALQLPLMGYSTNQNYSKQILESVRHYQTLYSFQPISIRYLSKILQILIHSI